jgi:predicted porin
MKKSLIALAVGGAFVAPAAMAQTSNVVLSGQLKLGYEYLIPDGANLPNANVPGVNSWNTSRVANETSFVRFSGSEDLGNGLRAVFQIESEVNGDVQGGFFASRNSGAGLSSNAFGTLMFGRWDTHYLSHAGVEGAGFGGTALALKANSLNILNWVNGLGSAGTRLSNVIRYVTPNYSGFEGEFIYSFDGENARTGGVSGTQNGRAAEWAATLRYNAGPINAFASYMQRHNQATELANYANTPSAISAAANAAQTLSAAAALVGALTGGQGGNALPQNLGTLNLEAVRFGGAYTFGFGSGFRFKAGAIGDWISWDFRTGTNNQTERNSERWAWSVPLSLGFGPHTGYFTYSQAANASGNISCAPTGSGASTPGCNGGGTGAVMYMIGYDYALSKRTSVGGNYVLLDNGAQGYYDFWSRGVGVTRPGGDIQSFYVGLRHLF